MALNYLLSPEFQIVNTAGKPATGGYLEVYISGSRERYYCASDFNGTLYPFQVPLDSLGSNVVLADDSYAYDVYIYNRYGGELMSRYNVHPRSGGGIGTGDITSSDDSIIVTQTANGVDLRTNSTPPSILRATAATLYADGQFVFSEAQRDGQNAIVDAQGKVIVNEGWWHYDATVRLRWNGPAQNETQSVSLYTQNASDSMTVDLSFAHSETVQVSGEYKALNDSTQFVLGVTGVPSGMSVELVDFGVHSIVGEGAGGKYKAGNGIVIDEPNRIISVDFDEVQAKLTAGTGISIDDEGVISVDESAINEIFPVTYDVTTVSDIRSALMAGKLPVLFLGDAAEVAISVRRIPIHDFFDGSTYRYAQFWQPYVYTSSSASYPPYANFAVYSVSYDVGTGETTWSTSYKYIAEQSDWAEADATKLTFIKNKPANLVQDANYVHTDNNYTNADVTKLAGIAAGAEVNVQSNWTEADTTADSYIQNKPTNLVQDASYVHTDNNFTDADVSKLAGIAAGAEVNVQSDWTEVDTAADSYIQNKPAETTLTAGSNITITESGSTLTIAATVPAQQQANWTEADNTSVQYIQNKPANLVQDASYVHTDNNFTNADVSKLAGIAAGAEVNVQSDWTEADNTADSYIQHKPSEKSLVAGSNITLTEAADSVTIAATVPAQQQANWTEADNTSVQYIQNKPANLVQDASYVHTDNNFTNADVSKLAGIASGAEVNVQSDWTEADNTADSYIQNKPTLATVATSGSYTDLLNTPDLSLKEDVANKAQSVSVNSQTDYPSSYAVANFVNSSVSTNTAKFLGNFTLTDLSLTYPATNAQIETALDGYAFSPAPTNNDYVYVEISDPQTPGVTDVVKRFKYDGTNWLYEYALNNSSFTPQEIAAIDSGVNATKVGNYDTHIADATIHVTSTDKTTWSGKQDAISDLQTIRTGAGLGATAVQPGDLATVATSGLYSDLSGTPTINNVPTVTSSDDSKVLKASYTGGVGSYSWEQESGGTVTDVEVDGVSVVSGGVASITMPTDLVPTVTSSDDSKVLKASYTGGVGSYSWEAESGGTVTDVEVNGTSVVSGGVADITIPAQVQADWAEADNTADSYIENKPVPKTLVAGTGITITETANDLTVAATQTSYTAGTGLKLTGTAFSVDETSLFTSDAGDGSPVLSESPMNFERLKIYFGTTRSGTSDVNIGMSYTEVLTSTLTGGRQGSPSSGYLTLQGMFYGDNSTQANPYITFGQFTGCNTTTWTRGASGIIYNLSTGTASTSAGWIVIYKVIGVNRITP